MKIEQQINFIVINKTASSLYSVIADGEYHSTSLGRSNWESLIGSEGALQANCNKEGFNAKCTIPRVAKARIGILGNNENECNSCDSSIGFGTGGSLYNGPSTGGGNGNVHIKAMGFIFVQ